MSVVAVDMLVICYMCNNRQVKMLTRVSFCVWLIFNLWQMEKIYIWHVRVHVHVHVQVHGMNIQHEHEHKDEHKHEQNA
jgi:hypothetical protein